MKEIYIAPEMEIIVFGCEDVITVSNPTTEDMSI